MAYVIAWFTISLMVGLLVTFIAALDDDGKGDPVYRGLDAAFVWPWALFCATVVVILAIPIAPFIWARSLAEWYKKSGADKSPP